MLPPTVHHQSRSAELLQTLIRLNRESEQCFRSAADRMQDAELTALFYSFARQRRDFAVELARYRDEHPDVTGAATGAADPPAGAWATMHRWWHALRQRLATDEAEAALRLAEGAEEEIREVYEELLRHPLDPEVAALLQRQHDQVAEAEQRIHRLHEARAVRYAG